MGGITIAELRHGLRRFLAPAVAILLGVGFFTATLALSSTMQGTLERTAAAEVTGYAAVVSGDSLGPEQVKKVRATSGVERVGIEQTGSVKARGKDSNQTQALNATTAAPTRLKADAGRTSAGPGEVLLNREAAATLGARPGSTVTIGGSPGTAERRTVAGIVQVTGRDSLPLVVGSSAEISQWSGEHSYDALLVAAGDSPTQVAQQVRDRLGDDVTVRTAQEEIDSRVSELITGVRFITMFFGIFAAIALFVAGMVIANTFQILLAQRSRQLALMRCVGASRRQIIRTVMTESLALGIVASAVGVLAGIGAVAGFVEVSDRMGLTLLPLEQLSLSLVAVAAPLALGVLVTVASALQPARRASRVAPLAALRPELAPTGRSRTSRVRLTVGAALAVLGFAGMLQGALAGSAPVAVPAGLLSFLGIILTAPVVVPALARMAGRFAGRWAGVPGELATDNTVRNPRRTAATSTALLIGITLMASMVVGSATSKSAISQSVDEQFAMDVQVISTEHSLPGAVRRQIADTDGVDRSAALDVTRVKVPGPKLTHEQDVIGVPDSARQVLRDPSVLDGIRDGHVLVDTSTASDFGLSDGASLKLGGVPLTVDVQDGGLDGFSVTTSDLRRIDPQATASSMWLRLTPEADAGKTVGEVREAASPVGADVSGSAGARAELDTMVQVMLLIVSALLGVAVLIALVGVANTLGLSVLERRRETALLRALGFTARQVRQTLALEALLVALVAAVVGTGLGVVYGWAGTRAVLGAYAEGVVPQVPIGLLLLLVGGAAGCGLLASWAPARRASRTAPVAALASE